MESRHRVLFEQLKTYRGELLEMVAGVSEAESEIIPRGFNNNIRWNLGHIYVDQYIWIRTLTKEEIPVPLEFIEWFGYGSSPSRFNDETPTFSQLIPMLQQQPFTIQEKYKNRLEEKFAPTEMGIHTIEQVLIRTIFHEGLHLSAIQAIKRQLYNKAGRN